jgi:hypothetical protein
VSNSNTDASRASRQRNKDRWLLEQKARGAKQIYVLLSKEDAERLDRLALIYKTKVNAISLALRKLEGDSNVDR